MAERKTYILIEHNGERQLVKSLAGHEGCKVIKDRVPEPPSPHCTLCPKGKWVADPGAAERAEIRKLVRAGRLKEALERVRDNNA